MKPAQLVLVALACLVAPVAFAAEKESINASISMKCDPPVRWADRHVVSDARFAITTDNRKVVLLLTNRVVALQLSDRVFRKVDRKFKEAEHEDDDALGRAIKTAVLASVRSLLDHSAECEIRDIVKVDYRDGELILMDRNGQRIFGDAEVDDDDVMRNFSEVDARAFVRQLRQRMARES